MRYRRFGQSDLVVSEVGFGTWTLVTDWWGRTDHPHAMITAALDAGINFIDTAPVYGTEGAGESILAPYLTVRDDIVITTKCGYDIKAERKFPGQSERPADWRPESIRQQCEDSLRRLNTDRIDLYLLHWRGNYKLKDTLAGFQALVKDGLIKAWGVSNFGAGDMDELAALPGGDAVATNQMPYSLARRGIETDPLPWCRARGIPIMAYSPVDQGRILADRTLASVAGRHGASPAQVALAFVLLHKDMIVIPKATSPTHVRENRAALDLELTKADLAELGKAFPPPRGAPPLEML